MRGGEFRSLAESVTRAYGDDPWFFLRELAQNSRDAGARQVRVSARVDADGAETIDFADDGRGMTLRHARSFLFRLYASDKAGDRTAAGRYGIGFWTVLRFGPSSIGLQSRRGRRGWAVSLDAELTARPAACRLDRPGTVVSLSRPRRCASEAEFQRQVEEGLRSFCRYLRRNDRRGSPLPVFFAGQNLTEPMVLPGPLSLSFRSGPLEGAVGLGAEPEVRLYARGLPVWRGTLLSQMSHLHAAAAAQADVGAGLAPVFLLNGNHLDVTFSRNLAVENRALDLVRRRAEAALRRLLERALERSFPRTRWQRLKDRIGRASSRIPRLGWRWVVPLLIAAPLAALILRLAPLGPRRPAAAWPGPGSAALSYRGALVAAAPPAAPPLFSYSPGIPVLFRLFAAETYTGESGFVRGAGREWTAPPLLPCLPGYGLEARLASPPGEIFLPQPPGWGVVPGSLRLEAEDALPVSATLQGEAVARLPRAGVLTYRLCPEAERETLSPAEESLFLALPGLPSLPADLQAEAASALGLSPPARANLARRLASSRLRYDDSPGLARISRLREGGGDWLGMVLEIGAGDCDVINGLQVLLLRKMALPSRLAIGLVGDNGLARPRRHAWAEYFDRGWKASDATAAVGRNGPAGGGSVPAATGPAAAAPRAASAALLIFGATLAVLAAWAHFSAKRRSRPQTGNSAGEAVGPLLQAARQSLLQPGLWGDDSPLRRHPLLPLLAAGPDRSRRGSRISLQRAQELMRRGRLFVPANRNPLAQALAADGAAVLDLGEPLAAALGILFPGAVDSDLLCRLRPAPAEGLLAGVNLLLSRRRLLPFLAGGGPSHPLLLAPGLETADMLRVDLPVVLRAPPFFFPRRFIAVAPQGTAYAEASRLYAAKPALAAARLLRHAHGQAGIGPALLRRASRRLLRRRP